MTLEQLRDRLDEHLKLRPEHKDIEVKMKGDSGKLTSITTSYLRYYGIGAIDFVLDEGDV